MSKTIREGKLKSRGRNCVVNTKYNHLIHEEKGQIRTKKVPYVTLEVSSIYSQAFFPHSNLVNQSTFN